MNILSNLRSAFAKNQRRNVIAATAAAALVAGIVGTAAAISPTITLNNRTHQGGVQIVRNNLINGFTNIYTVPANRSLMLTDIIVGTLATTSGSFIIYASPNVNCTGATQLTAYIPVPAQNTVVIALVSGMGVATGGNLCFSNTDSELLQVTLRGYVFT